MARESNSFDPHVKREVFPGFAGVYAVVRAGDTAPGTGWALSRVGYAARLRRVVETVLGGLRCELASDSVRCGGIGEENRSEGDVGGTRCDQLERVAAA